MSEKAGPVQCFDLSDWTQLELSGPDARRFLHSFCTNEIQQLQVGERTEAFICDIKGRILGHVLVVAADESLRLMAVPGSASVLLSHFNKYRLDAKLEIEDRSTELGLLCLSGRAIEAVLAVASPSLSPLPGERSSHTVQTAEGELLLCGSDVMRPPGILLSGPRPALADLKDRLRVSGILPGTNADFEFQRIAAGFPWYGRDLTQEHIAQEAGRTGRAISFSKGCYLGQEPIARLDAMGHTNRELRGLRIAGGSAAPGDRVLADDTDIGSVSSAAFSPDEGLGVALAVIRTKHAAPGTALTVRTSAGVLQATVYWPGLADLST